MANLRSAGNGVDGRHGCLRDSKERQPAYGAEVGQLPSGDATWDVLAGAMIGERAELTHRVCEAIQADLSAYRMIPRAVLDAEVSLELSQVLRSAGAAQASLAGGEIAEFAAVGEERARQGVPVDDLHRAWRIGIGVVVDYAREVGQRLSVDDARILEFVQSVLACSDLAMVATTCAHRGAERVVSSAADEREANFVRATLLGMVPHAELRIQAEMYGLDPAGEYVAVRTRLGQAATRGQLKQALGLDDSAHKRTGLCAIVDGDIAGFFSEAPPSRIEGIVGVGPPTPLERLAESYRSAVRALVTAEACQLQGAYDIASLGLRPALALDTEVGELLRRRYLQPLAATSSAGELIATLRVYLACGMHVERTATRLFVHQNTVRYRIARFEELTGACLADTEVLLEVWWALELSAMNL